MIVQFDFLNKLKALGLNSYEAKLWVALLSVGTSTAGELSDIANVPRSRSYDILESLEKKGFVVLKLGKPIKYLAVPPTEVVERVKKNMHQAAQSKIDRLNNLKDTDILNELTTLHSQGIELVAPADLSGSLRGRHNLYNHLESMIRNAEKSVTIMTTTQGFIRKIEGLKPMLEKVKKNGVDIKIAAPISKECKGALKDIANIAEVRHTDGKARFTIVDGKDLVFMVLNDSGVHPTYDVGIWVNTPFFASALDNMFGTVWNNMPTAEEALKK